MSLRMRGNCSSFGLKLANESLAIVIIPFLGNIVEYFSKAEVSRLFGYNLNGFLNIFLRDKNNSSIVK